MAENVFEKNKIKISEKDALLEFHKSRNEWLQGKRKTISPKAILKVDKIRSQLQKK